MSNEAIRAYLRARPWPLDGLPPGWLHEHPHVFERNRVKILAAWRRQRQAAFSEAGQTFALEEGSGVREPSSELCQDICQLQNKLSTLKTELSTLRGLVAWQGARLAELEARSKPAPPRLQKEARTLAY